MAFAYTQTPGNGSNRLFTVSFPYLLRIHVKAFLNYDLVSGIGAELVDGVGFTWLSDTQIQATAAPVLGSTLTLIRKTPSGAQLVVYATGSPPTGDNLNDADLQALYAIQEQADLAAATAALTSTVSVAVAGALPYQPIATVGSIPAPPTNGQRIEISDSTGIESFSPLAGKPSNFIGASDLLVRLAYTTTGNTWQWVDVRAADPDSRYTKKSSAFTVNVRDFGASATSNDVPAFVAASQAPGNPTVLVPSGSYTFPTTPALEPDSVFIFDRDVTITGPGKWPTSAKRVHFGQCKSFVRELAGGIYFYLDNNAAINVRPSITSIGISSAQQTSDITYGLGTGSGAISFGSFIHNNNQTSDTTAWPFYSTVLHENDLGTSHCMEVDIFNKGAVVELTPYRPFKSGLTNGLWVASGGEYTFQSTVQPEIGIASVAIAIVGNDGRPVKTACWDKGIIFHNQSIRGVDGFESTGGNGCAIGFANRHFMKWFRNTDDAVIAEIGSTSNGVQPTRITFTDLGLLVSSMANSNVALAVESPVAATTGVQIAPNANSGSSPLILARGSAANIDLLLAGKGAGSVGLYGGSRMKWVNSSTGGTLAEIINSGSGGVRPQLNLSADFGFFASSAVNGNTSLAIETPSDATTGVQIAPNANGGVTPLIQSRGDAANIDLWLAPKGSGYLRFGFFVGTPVTNNGYITIRDTAGNLVKLMTAA